MIIGILSDAHGNLPAFDKAVSVLIAHGAERFVFLGDAVGYFPGTSIVERLFVAKIPSILGNHEAMLLADDYSENREPIYRLREVSGALTDEQRAFIASWPIARSERTGGKGYLFVHGSPNDPVFGYVYPDTDLDTFDPEGADFVFMGNTHRPFIRENAGTIYVNVGSCGLPRDQGGLGAACLLDTVLHKVLILRFDISQGTKKVVENSCPHPSIIKLISRTCEGEPFGERCD